MTSATPAKTPVAALPAATLLLLRDGSAGLEVLMTMRHASAGFAGGAMVFPGGKVDAEDSGPGLRRAAGEAANIAGPPFRIAAIRETYEETGILLARGKPGGELLTDAQLASLRARHSGDFAAFAAAAGIELATDLLTPFAHWITPADQPKRFDTQFFLAPAPADQVARHDGREAVETRWVAPAAAIADADAGRIKLVFATRLNLWKLGRSASVAQAFEAARRSTIVTVEPKLVETPEGPAFRIPEAADYGLTHMPVSRIRRA